MNSTDEVLEQMILRTSSIVERLQGSAPTAVSQATKGSSGAIETRAEVVGDKLRSLMNNIAVIDNAI